MANLVVTILFIAIQLCTLECSKVTCDSGYEVCLWFNIDNRTSNVLVIRRNNINTCLTIRKNEAFLFETSWRNKTYNCSVTLTTMSLCFGNCQAEDAGIFTLHESATNESPSIENIELHVTECMKGYFGKNCSYQCSVNCNIVDRCDRYTGQCKGGCKPGWTGYQCNLECPSGYYGKDCNQLCNSNCFVTNKCNRFTGQCDEGCKPGWRGYMCDQECPEGYHGRNCLNQCSVNCKLTNRCDRFTGQCIEGCNPGWIGDTCAIHQVCGRGYFGPDCKNKCGHCLNVSQCHYINGSCLAGCLHGYRGDYCNQTCPRGFYGLDCASRCNTYCRGNETCDHVIGRCDEGCKNELIGPMCNKVDKTYRDQQPCSNHIPIIISVFLSIVIVLSGSVINFIFWRKKAGHNIPKRREIQKSKDTDTDAPQHYTELEEVGKPNTYDEIISYAN